jgi:hypothetical protein
LARNQHQNAQPRPDFSIATIPDRGGVNPTATLLAPRANSTRTAIHDLTFHNSYSDQAFGLAVQT